MIEMGIIDERWKLSDRHAPEWDTFERKEDMALRMAVYAAQVDRMDQGIGKVLAKLRQIGAEENTLVMFTSDNGPQFGRWGRWDATRFNCNLNGSKGHVYEGGIRVPMVLRWPAGLDGRRRFDDFVHFTDWLPTLCAVAGTEPVGELALDGENILPILRGEGGRCNPRRFWQWNRYTPVACSNAAMRDGKWKLVRPQIAETMHLPEEETRRDQDIKFHPERFTDICREPEPPREVPDAPPAQLYDLDADPGEQNDLAEVHPDVVALLKGRMEAWIARREQETGLPNPIYHQGDWHGHEGVGAFKTSQQAYDTLHIGDRSQAAKLQAKER